VASKIKHILIYTVTYFGVEKKTHRILREKKMALLLTTLV